MTPPFRASSSRRGENPGPLRLTVPRDVVREELEARIAKGNAILEQLRDPPIVRNSDFFEGQRADYHTWDLYNETLLEQRFETLEIASEYTSLLGAHPSPESLSDEWDYLLSDVRRKVQFLDSVRERVPLFDEPEAPRAAVRAMQVEPARTDPTTVFIVHGRDEAAKLAVHGFLRDVTSLNPVILHDQANAGRTIIEKFEDHAAAAAYAVVILTGDDAGGVIGGDQQPRARQNVIFEFGFFVAALGRGRVAILYKDGVELPSDIDGVAFIPLDDAGAWRLPLARELKAAQLPIDADKLLL